MPVYTTEQLADREPWVEVEAFEQVFLDWRHQPTRRFERQYAAENLVCLTGEVVVESAEGRVTLKRKDWMAIPEGGATVTSLQQSMLTGSSEVLWMGGHWPESYYMSMFRFFPGRPLEVHYHDNDEYWFVFRGRARAQYAGGEVDIRAGQVLATGMGAEHGLLEPTEVFEGVGFTPWLDGERRFGHLHRDEHGVPTPARSGYQAV